MRDDEKLVESRDYSAVEIKVSLGFIQVLGVGLETQEVVLEMAS